MSAALESALESANESANESAHDSAEDARAPFDVKQQGAWLVAHFDAPHVTCSWAIVGGGLTQASAVAWHQIDDRDLRPPVDARDLLRDRMAARGLTGAVGLLTSRRLHAYTDVAREAGGVRGRCVATVGLGNALRAGNPHGVFARIGTINALVWVDAPLSTEALLEASAIATEAKAAALLASGVLSPVSGLPATGTGTDCVVVASPIARRTTPYAGKHTAVGHVVGASVHVAIAEGVEGWLREREARR